MSENGYTDQEYIQSVIKAREESVEFFSSANRAEREIWVANEFLVNLGISFTKSELKHIVNDPPDVRFNNASFEIKEILDSGRRRHKEYKDSLEKAKTATSPQDLLEEYTPRDVCYTEIYQLIEKDAEKYSKKYPLNVKKNLDLLFYVELVEARGYIQAPLPKLDKLIETGFRSISFVSGSLSGVLYTNEYAPNFLLTGGPRVIRKNELAQHNSF